MEKKKMIVDTKLKVGDIVEVNWHKEWDGWLCPICKGFNFGYDQISMCEHCESNFRDIHCIEIEEIGNYTTDDFVLNIKKRGVNNGKRKKKEKL